MQAGSWSERAFGHQSVTKFKRYLLAYRVESVSDGRVITRGWGTGRIIRASQAKDRRKSKGLAILFLTR